MSSAPSKHVLRPAPPRRLRAVLRLALPATAAALVTASVVGVAVSRDQHSATDLTARPLTEPVTLTVPGGEDRDSPYRADRDREFSRSAERVTIKRLPKVTDHEFSTARLNVWPAAREKGRPLAVLHEGSRLATTGAKKRGFAQVVRNKQVRWVNADYLAEKKPARASDGTSAGVSSAPCPDGSGTESGLTSSAVTLFRAVCNAFPALSTYGGYDAHGEHASGRAIDFMISDPSLGQAVADWVRAHASQLNIYDVIWSQHIWTPVRSAEGWRSMPNRGSATANHYDHVHVSVN